MQGTEGIRAGCGYLNGVVYGRKLRALARLAVRRRNRRRVDGARVWPIVDDLDIRLRDSSWQSCGERGTSATVWNSDRRTHRRQQKCCARERRRCGDVADD